MLFHIVEKLRIDIFLLCYFYIHLLLHAQIRI